MDRSHWRLLWSLASPRWRSFALYGLVLSAATALPIAASFVLAAIVQGAIDGAATRDLVILAGIYAVLGLVRSGMQVAVSWRATALAWDVTDELRHDLARLVLEADLAFHRDRSPGELVTRADADVTEMTRFFSSIVARVVAVVVMAIGAAVVMAIVEPANALPYAVVMTIVLAVFWAQRDWGVAAAVRGRTAEADEMSIAEQYLSGAVDVASLGAGRHGVARLATAIEARVVADRQRVVGQFVGMGAVRVVTVMAMVVMIVWSSWRVSTGAADVASVVLAYRFVDILRQPIEVLGWRLLDSPGAVGSAQRVLALLAAQTRVQTGTEVLPEGPLAVSFDAATLVYDDDEGDIAALDQISLDIPARHSLGLLGRTGSGKTTMARLLLHLVDPTRGAVRVGGIDTRDCDDDSFRSRVRAVVQDVQLFPGTVRDNVTLFTRGDDDAVIAALRAVGLSDWFDALPDGLDTMLASGSDDAKTSEPPTGPTRSADAAAATGVSAGQAQLLTLARAMIDPGDVLVLDEATARVDPETQRAIAEAMDSLMAQATSVVIAHRLETLARCDAIAVLDNGRVIEYGPRVALAADPTSRYAQLLATAAIDPHVELEELR